MDRLLLLSLFVLWKKIDGRRRRLMEDDELKIDGRMSRKLMILQGFGNGGEVRSLIMK